ncbi:MAG: spore maturation protein [Ruminococcaceae bacterium]|nr:spore maturation protein [Oscillospiraceae bacterium]
MNVTVYIVPVVICTILICAAFKKVDILKEFSKGAADGLKTAVNLVPTLALLLTAIGMFRASGALNAVTSMLSKGAEFIGLPSEVLPLVLLKPFSGSGSIAIIEDIFSNYGTDSFAGRVASVIAGSTETTFYTIAVYYGAVNISKTRHTIPAALSADIAGFILSAFFVRLFFY